MAAVLLTWAWKRAGVLAIDPGEDRGESGEGVPRRVEFLPGHAAAELGVERRQRRLDAAAGIGFHDRRIVDRGELLRVEQERLRRIGDLAAERPHDLVVGQGIVDRLLQRQIPHLPGRGILERERSHRPVDLVEALLLHVRILDVGGHIEVVGKVAVFMGVEGLLGMASGQCDHRPKREDTNEEGIPAHVSAFLLQIAPRYAGRNHLDPACCTAAAGN